MFHVRQGKYQIVVQELHKKYGPVVRIAPNVLDLDIPELIKTIYNTKADYLKVRDLCLVWWVLLLTCNRLSFTMAVAPKPMAR